MEPAGRRKAGAAVLARGGNNTWAPDVIHVGDQYFVYYSAPATQPRSAIGLLVGTPLSRFRVMTKALKSPPNIACICRLPACS